MGGLLDRKIAGHGRAFADDGIDAHFASVQFDKGTNQRQPEPRAAMA